MFHLRAASDTTKVLKLLSVVNFRWLILPCQEREGMDRENKWKLGRREGKRKKSACVQVQKKQISL